MKPRAAGAMVLSFTALALVVMRCSVVPLGEAPDAGNGIVCPDSPKSGDACPEQAGKLCVYGDIRYCQCSPGPNCPTDVWNCDTSDFTRCPKEPPELGSACDATGARCFYPSLQGDGGTGLHGKLCFVIWADYANQRGCDAGT